MVSTPNFTDGTWRLASTEHLGGDPNGDILWQNIANSSLVLWQQDGTATTATTTLPSLANYTAVAVGDVDGDGIGDVLLENRGSAGNTWRSVYLSSTSQIANYHFAGAVWQTRAATDTNGDGRDDAIWFNTNTGQITVFQLNGAAKIGAAAFASGYAGDDLLLTAYNGTAINSFYSLWYDTSANSYDLARYNAGARTISENFTVGAGMEYVMTGDFDGDGNPDHLFINPTGVGRGDAEVVFTSGTGIIGRINWTSAQESNQRVVAGGDFDGDGNTELLLRHAVSGELRLVNAIGGGAASDTLVGGNGDDMIDGSASNDQIFGGAGNDILLGGGGNDSIYGQSGDDWIEGGIGHDTLQGGDGDDQVYGHDGDDVIFGGAGNDIIFTGNGSDFADGNDGDDLIIGGAFGFEHLRGGAGNDTLIGDDNAILEGGDGDDVLIAADNGLDRLFGGNGNDFLVGGLSSDVLYGGDGDDILYGTDRAGVSGTSDTLYGGSGADFFYLGNESTKFYTGGGHATIKDFSSFAGDHVVLSGFTFDYSFVDIGPHVEIRLASNANLIAVLENVATVTEVTDNTMYIA